MLQKRKREKNVAAIKKKWLQLIKKNVKRKKMNAAKKKREKEKKETKHK